jgi:hypothetical protein
MKKNIDRLKKVNKKGDMVNYIMSHFTCNEWIYDSPTYHKFQEIMSEEDKSLFDFDIPAINWRHYTYLYCYGMQTYVMKQKGVPIPQENYDDIIAKHPSQTYFDDILWSYNRGKLNKQRKESEVLSIITNAPNVVKAMRDYIETTTFRKKYDGYSDKELMEVAETKVHEYAKEM